MEKSLNGIRDTFYQDLIDGYQRKSGGSFLYRYFWRENMNELLEKYFPGLLPNRSPQAKDEPRIRARLRAAMGERSDWARSLLLKAPPRGDRKERRDFWQELMLNDAGYQAGLIPDTDYYAWLVEYLSVRDIYYKGDRRWSGHIWLYPLLQAGLGLRPDQLRRNGMCIRIKAQVDRDLKELGQLLREEWDAGKADIAGRLRGLTTRDGEEYLLWLTRCLEGMAIHVKIKTWLQDSGYPLGDEGKIAPSQKGPRKQDFSMRLFETYCDSPQGYDFMRKGLAGWRPGSDGFCVLGADAQQPEVLQSALETRGDQPYLYLPLAVHLHSGCVFFLAGKEIYRGLYQTADRQTKAAYDSAEARFCFDYLRLDNTFWRRSQKAVLGPFRLQPTFHENVGRSYDAVLSDFKRYCTCGDESALQSVKGLNLEGPAGTPDAFCWAFDGLEEPPRPKPSREAAAAFRRARDRAR